MNIMSYLCCCFLRYKISVDCCFPVRTQLVLTPSTFIAKDFELQTGKTILYKEPEVPMDQYWTTPEQLKAFQASSRRLGKQTRESNVQVQISHQKLEALLLLKPEIRQNMLQPLLDKNSDSVDDSIQDNVHQRCAKLNEEKAGLGPEQLVSDAAVPDVSTEIPLGAQGGRRRRAMRKVLRRMKGLALCRHWKGRHCNSQVVGFVRLYSRPQSSSAPQYECMQHIYGACH